MFWLFLILFVGFLYSLWEQSKKDKEKLARPPVPEEGKDYNFENGPAEYTTVNSVGGSWSDPDIGWHEIQDTLHKYGFTGFESYEEVELGGADMTFPEDQVKVIKALKKFADAFPNCELLPLDCGKRIFRSDILKLIHIFKSGRAIIPW